MNWQQARAANQTADMPGGVRNGLAPNRTARLARAAGIIYLQLILVYMLAGLPLVFAQTQTVCDGSLCLDWQLSATGLQKLTQVGIPIVGYALYATLLPLLVPLLSLALATLVLWRQPASPMAWLFVLVLGTCPVNLSMSTVALARANYDFLLPAQLVEFAFVGFLPFVLLFPDGRFVPSWSRWFIIPNVFAFVLIVFFPATQAPGTTTAAINGAWQAVAAVLSLSILAHRYFRVANFAQRRQIKWLLYGLGLAIATGLIFAGLAAIPGIDLQPGSIGFLFASWS